MNHPRASGEAVPPVFWGELAPCDHVVQFYGDEDGFLDTLQAYVAEGIASGEAVVLVVTPGHLAALEARLGDAGVDLELARRRGFYTALDAQHTLDRFMVDGWPDDDAFAEVVDAILEAPRAAGLKVRAFGEMVAMLWSAGHCGATVRLEYLWQTLCRKEDFALFCAYPKSGFTGDPTTSLLAIRAAHSRVLPG